MIVTNLMSNMVVTLFGGVPTNTPAFHDNAYRLMLTNAQALSLRLRLDKSLLETNPVNWFKASAFPNGPTAGIQFANRFTVQY